MDEEGQIVPMYNFLDIQIVQLPCQKDRYVSSVIIEVDQAALIFRFYWLWTLPSAKQCTMLKCNHTQMTRDYTNELCRLFRRDY